MLPFELFQELTHVGSGVFSRNSKLRGEAIGDLLR
jgi:hypothetical protein